MWALEEGDNERDAEEGRKKEGKMEGEKLFVSLGGSGEEKAVWT